MTNKCHNCGNTEFESKKVDNVFNIDDKLYLVKNIPALACTRCGEKYFTPETQRETLALIQKKSNRIKKIEAEVYDFN